MRSHKARDCYAGPMAVPRVLTIAGSDPSGGAGLQADLKTFHAHGAYGMAVVSALTAQNTAVVRSIELPTASFLRAQLDALVDDCPPTATKTGMLPTAAAVRLVAEYARRGHLGVVVADPVLVATSGDVLVSGDAVAAIREELMPAATVLTPNLPEALVLCGWEPSAAHPIERIGDRLLELGARSVLLKGGHCDGDQVEDWLFSDRGASPVVMRARRVPGGPFHGTGCTLSAGIAARLAHGDPLLTACETVIAWLRRALARSWAVGGGARPVDHLTPVTPEDLDA